MNTIPQTDILSNLPQEGYTLCTDSQDIREVCQCVGIPRQYQDGITAVYVLIGEGDYLDVWMSESPAPYLLGATYHNVAYYTSEVK